MSPLEKMQVALKQTAAQKQVKRIVRTVLCRNLGVNPSKDDEDDSIPLAKLASNNWNDSDSDNVPLSALTKHSI